MKPHSGRVESAFALTVYQFNPVFSRPYNLRLSSTGSTEATVNISYLRTEYSVFILLTVLHNFALL